MEALFHLVSHPWLKHEPREAASQGSLRQLESVEQVHGRRLQLLTVVNNKIMIWYDMVWYDKIRYGMIYDMVWYDTILYMI